MRIFTIISMLALCGCSIYTDGRSSYALEDHRLIESCIMALGEKGSKNFDFYKNYIRSRYGVVSISRNSHSNYITLNFGRTSVESSEKNMIVEPPPILCVIDVERGEVVKLHVPEGLRNRDIKKLIKPDQPELDREYRKLKDAARSGEIATLSYKLYYFRGNNWVQIGEEEVSTVPVKDMF